MQVRDVMTCAVVTATPSMTLKEASRLLVEKGISGVPVVEHGRVVGVLSERDFLVKERGRPEPRRWLSWLAAYPTPDGDAAKLEAKTVTGAMTSPAVTISPTASVSLAAKRMLEANVSRLPVLQRDELVGIVTRADLMRAFARDDTEIEREINEEVLVRQLLLDPTEAHASVDAGNVVIAARQPIDAEIVERLVARVAGVVSVTTGR